MTVCSKCGKALPDAARFCPDCGAPSTEKEKSFCTSCGKELKDGAAFCTSCGAKVSKEPAVKTENNEASATVQQDLQTSFSAAATAVKEKTEETVSQSVSTTPSSDFAPVSLEPPAPAKKRRAVKVIIPVAAIILVFAIAVGVLFSFVGSRAPEGVVYLKDEEISYSDLKNNFDLSDNLIGGSSMDFDDIIDNEYYDMVKVSSDGKRIFYPDKIKNSSGGYNLYMKPFGKKNADGEKVASDVSAYMIDKKGKNVLYAVYDGDNYTVYKTDLNERKKIAKDVTDVYASENLERIWYVTENKSLYLVSGKTESERIAKDVEELYPVDEKSDSVFYMNEDDVLYKATGAKTTKIASDVNSAVYVLSADKIYYSKAPKAQKGLSEFVTDNKKDADNKLSKPQYPYMSDFETYDEYEAAYESYKNDLYEYYEKQDRDAIREKLDETYNSYQSKELYLYNGKKSVKISDNFSYLEEANEKSGVLFFGAYDKSNIKKVDISEVDSIDDLQDEIEEVMDANRVYYMVNGEKSAKLSVSGNADFVFSDDGKTVYYTEDISENSEGVLYKASVSGTKLSGTKKIDSGVYVSFSAVTESGDIYYFKNADDYIADLYFNGDKVDDEVYIYSFSVDKNTIYYISDYDDDEYTGTLRKATGKKKEKIADDVIYFLTTSSGELAYLSDWSGSDQNGDLYVLKGGKGKKIEGNVSLFTTLETDFGGRLV